VRAKKFDGDRVVVARGLRCQGAKAPGRLGCSGADVTSVLARSVWTVWDRGRTDGPQVRSRSAADPSGDRSTRGGRGLGGAVGRRLGRPGPEAWALNGGFARHAHKAVVQVAPWVVLAQREQRREGGADVQARRVDAVEGADQDGPVRVRGQPHVQLPAQVLPTGVPGLLLLLLGRVESLSRCGLDVLSLGGRRLHLRGGCGRPGG